MPIWTSRLQVLPISPLLKLLQQSKPSPKWLLHPMLHQPTSHQRTNLQRTNLQRTNLQRTNLLPPVRNHPLTSQPLPEVMSRHHLVTSLPRLLMLHPLVTMHHLHPMHLHLLAKHHLLLLAKHHHLLPGQDLLLKPHHRHHRQLRHHQ
jgi:hypothetical protein